MTVVTIVIIVNIHDNNSTNNSNYNVISDYDDNNGKRAVPRLARRFSTIV